MLKSMLMRKRNSKGIVKSNFVTSCLVFRGSIPIASTVGSLMFAIICTRPDIAQAVGTVSQFIANPGREHCNIVKRILGYIKGTTNATLCFGESKFIVKCYINSNFAGDPDKRKSTMDYVFTLTRGAMS